MSDNRTMVLVALPHTLSPVQPHKPGGFIVGYVEGGETEAMESLNKHKQDKTCAKVQNAWIMQTATYYQPVLVNEQGEVIRKIGQLPPGQALPPEAKMQTVTETSISALTNIDAANGCDYYIEPIMWVIPKGVMISKLEDHMQAASARMVQKSGLSLHSQIPQGTPTNN